MIRILTVSKPYVAAAYRNKLAHLAKDKRFEVGLICPTSWGGQDYEVENSGVSENSDVFWNRQLPVRLNGKNHFHTYCNLEAAIKEFRPDILNVEEEHYSVVTAQAYRLAVKMGIKPVFYTWQNIHKRYPPPFNWIEQYVFRHSAGGIAGNQEAADILRKKGYGGPLAVIPQMGFDEDIFPPKDFSVQSRSNVKKKLGLNPDHFLVLFAGRVVEAKGIQDLLMAVRSLRDRDRERLLEGHNIRVLILGNGPYKPFLEDKFKDLLDDDVLRFRSGVASYEIPLYLQAADVLCLPSRTQKNWKEQFGRVLVEAMAAGAVVLGSSSGEIPTVIGDAGLVAEECNPDSIALALGKLSKDPKLCQNLRVQGAARAAAKFSNPVIARAFGDFFGEIST